MEKLLPENTKFVKIQKITDHHDGVLFVAEAEKNIPFEIKRVFFITDLNNANAIRGMHAHRNLEQVIFCINGKCRITIDDGYRKQNILLSNPREGIFIGKMVWNILSEFSDDCILLVFASDFFDEQDYIRDYQEFLYYVRK